MAEAAQAASATMPCSFRHMGHLEFYLLFLPQAQPLETIIANFPSCDMHYFSHAACRQNMGEGRNGL